MTKTCVGVIGSSSRLGECVIQTLLQQNIPVKAYSRIDRQHPDHRVECRQLANPSNTNDPIPLWISVTPLWVILDYFDLLKQHQVKKILVLSSTSRWTKKESSNPYEQATVQRLESSEQQLQLWSERNGVYWTILRPTLIYGYGQDKNITEILTLIRRFGFFPILGSGQGLRQPIHMDHVASACVKALLTETTNNQSYNIAGAETLSYRELVERLFIATGRKIRILSIPLRVFQSLIPLLRFIPRYRHWNTAMVERMNTDLVFDTSPAQQDFAFEPGHFVLNKADINPNEDELSHQSVQKRVTNDIK